jgi:cytochrome b
MTEVASTTSGARDRRAPDGVTSVKVWDPVVRITHWGVAAAVLGCSFLFEPEGNGADLHQLFGYVGVGLVVLRLVWGLVGPRHARLSSFPPNPMAALRHLTDLHRGRRHVHLSHNPAGALMVYNLWASVIAMGVTGYMMGTVAFFGIDWVEEAHEVIYGWIMVSVVLHLAGIVLDTVLTRVPLVPAMITGRKRVPTDRIG